MVKVLLVCVSHYLGHVAPELYQALCNMVRYTLQTPANKKDVIDFIVLTEQPCDAKGKKIPGNQARRWNMNKIRKYAIKNYDYIVKMDSDMIPPPHALVYLISTSRKYKAPIVTSLTPERPRKCRTDEFSQLMSWNNNNGRNNYIPNRIKKLRPFICTGNAGESFMLMNREALKKVEWPPYKSSGDFAFWKEVHKQKIAVVCNPRVICAHKTRSGPPLIRNAEWILKHWKWVILRNLERRRTWYHGLPYKWWYGLPVTQFLKLLPFHLDQKEEPKWFTYRGQKR